jgi:hypothetical protein
MTMRQRLAAGCGVVLTFTIAAAADETRPVPADFKLKIALFDVGDSPLESSELVVRQGRVYLFRSTSSEVVIVQPRAERVDLVDLSAGHRVQTSIPFRSLDDALGKLRSAIAASIEKREQEGGRANRVEAQMSRDLIEPKLKATFDASAHRLTLKGGSAEVVATGAAEPDGARLAFLGSVLKTIIKLESMRDPTLIPPFTELDTFAALVDEKHLRPTEVSILYRLAGPPRKTRWTYQYVPTLTERELEALARVDELRSRAPSLSFLRYEGRRGR